MRRELKCKNGEKVRRKMFSFMKVVKEIFQKVSKKVHKFKKIKIKLQKTKNKFKLQTKKKILKNKKCSKTTLPKISNKTKK